MDISNNHLIKILFLASDPTDDARLRLGQESREIREKLQLSKNRDRFVLEVRESVRPSDITQAIFDVIPNIVHFSGHGLATGGLCFENIVGSKKIVEPDTLSKLFELIADQVNCVVLNACHSEIQAKAIAQHIPFVVGMGHAIGDKAAIAFSVGFYKALGANHSFDKAYKFGCAEIGIEGIPEQLTPVFHAKTVISFPGDTDTTFQYVVTLDAKIDEINKPLLEAIIALLRQTSGDISLSLKKIEHGSIRLTLEGSQPGFEQLRSLFESGQLMKVIGISVQDIQKLEEENYLDFDDTGIDGLGEKIIIQNTAKCEQHEKSIEYQDSALNPMRIMVLGHSNVGKTYFLGSLFKLSYDICSNGFSIQSKKFNEMTDIQAVFGIISGSNKAGIVSTTVDIRSSSMVLKQGLDTLFDIEVTDIEGQALEPGRNVEVSEKIIDKIVDYDGLLLVLEAPHNELECDYAKQQLAQMLNFSAKALRRNKRIPITLVINKIDRLPKAKNIGRQVDEEISALKANLLKKYPGNLAKIIQEIKTCEGIVVNNYVKEAINSFEIFDICETFLTFFRFTSLNVPCKVFLSTSLGFGCVDTDNIYSFQEGNELYKPYGSGAAFLWTIYARLNSQSSVGDSFGMPAGRVERLIRELQEDITELHLKGRAYFDPENDDNEIIGSLQNIVNLRTGLDL